MWKVRMVKLGARLADRLGRDDADRLADVDRRAACQVAAVAGAADTALAVSQVSTERILTASTPAVFDRSNDLLVDQMPAATMTSRRYSGSTTSSAAVRPKNALAERRDDLAALDDRPDRQARVGAAIHSMMMASWATSTRRRVR